MFLLFNRIYFLKFQNAFIDGWYARIIIRLFNIILPYYFRISRTKAGGLKQKSLAGSPILIVSLTSFPVRINTVWLPIETLLRQTVKPNRVILWLYEGEFNGKASLPRNLLRLEKRGLEIRFCNENLMPHKKYYHTMLEYPEANVITVDDDMFYAPDLIMKLLRFHKTFPQSIICPITSKIKLKGNKISSYREWFYSKNNSTPSYNYLTMGGGGTFFPAGALHPDVFDKTVLKKLALTADDLWLKIMSLRNNTRVVSMAGEYPRFFVPIILKNNKKLATINIGEGQNDKIFKDLMEYYQIPASAFNDAD